MKCIIVDDEPLAIRILEEYVRKDSRLELTGIATNALEAFDLLNRARIDLQFLDIRLPGISGIDFLKALKQPPLTIFTTAYSEHAVTGFELEAADYLLKPITFERFEKSINRLFKQEETVILPTYTYFKVDRTLIKIDHQDILLAQAMKDYILLKTLSGNYIIYMTMNYLTALLPPAEFIRIHRSFIVNKNQIEQVSRNKVTVAGIEIPVSDRYKHHLLQQLIL